MTTTRDGQERENAGTAFIDANERVAALRTRPDLVPELAKKRARLRQADRDHAIGLAAVRNAARLTQADLAAVLGVGQAAVAKIERRPDLLLSTLRSYINGAGGHARLVVYFPDGDMHVELDLDLDVGGGLVTSSPAAGEGAALQPASSTGATHSEPTPDPGAGSTHDERHIMSGPEKRVVQKRPEGGYEVRAPGAKRASAVTRTQAEGIDRARNILANGNGGELQVRGRDGAIRKQDTVKPGNDPRSSKG